MAVVVFVRHGEALTNERGLINSDINGFPLVDNGRRQIEAVASELKKLKVTKLYTSPVQRARESAEIIGKELGLSPMVDDRLRERFHGELENTSPPNELWILEVDWKNTKAETWEAIETRAKSFLDSVSDSNEIIVAVTHESPIKALFMNFLGIDYALSPGIKSTNGSLNIIAKRKRYKWLALNYPVLTKHLVKKINSFV